LFALILFTYKKEMLSLSFVGTQPEAMPQQAPVQQTAAQPFTTVAQPIPAQPIPVPQQIEKSEPAIPQAFVPTIATPKQAPMQK
ncbi:MAG: hypothetical protein RR806_09110, partial [Oscillospiraceae bacterium]